MLSNWRIWVCFALAASAQMTGSSPCADLQQAFNEDDNTYPESMVVSCMQTIPFDKNNDARNFWNKFQAVMQFHSNTAWLKDPPSSSYKQPAMDLDARIATISKNIDDGKYTNQWDFEMDVQQLIHDTHEGHIFVNFGLSDNWRFSLPFSIVPVSMDGMTVPKLYALPLNETFDDYLLQIQFNEASPLSQINGQDVIEYLTNTSKATVDGFLETHTDWNGLFYTAIGAVNGCNGTLNSAVRPWGVEEFEFTWEDGTTARGAPRATLDGGRQLPANLSDPDVWYNSVVKERSSSAAATTVVVSPSQSTQSIQSTSESAAASASTTDSASSPSSSSALKRRGQLTGWSDLYPAYPPADIVQGQFREGAFSSGYYLQDVSLGVLSIPTFEVSSIKIPNGGQTFSTMFADFIAGAKSAGMEKILIDARYNPGGSSPLSTELFNNFFPQLTSWSGSRMKISPALNLLGEILTSSWSKLSSQQQVATAKTFPLLLDTPWIATRFLNPVTGKDFGSWEEIQQGSYIQKGDNFTPTMEFDWSHPDYDIAADVGFVIDGYGNRTQNGASNPWDPKDVVLLLDGLCSSTCAMLARKLSDAGVKTVVVGGLPQLGAMQGAAGVRGENSYVWEALNDDINLVLQKTPKQAVSQVASILPDPKNYLQVREGSFNLRDEIEPNASFPQQFAYLPADCRIFHTPSTYNNYTNLWKYAAHAIWPSVGMTGSCLRDSTAMAIKNSPEATSTGSASINSTNTISTSAVSTGAGPMSTDSRSQIKTNAASILHYKMEILGIVGFWMTLMV